MAKILIILPFSGAQFTGGLAVVNEQLTKALSEDHDVRLLTCQLNSKVMATQEGHGKAKILVIVSEDTLEMKSPGGKAGADERNKLYDFINSDAILEGDQVTGLLSDWTPDFILGHSRFSGPAAIKLRNRKYPNAQVGYFLHSYPRAEGILLTGYEAFEEPVDVELAEKKLAEEVKWIVQADVVLAMGPLMRWAATVMLKDTKASKFRVHEVISGVPDPAPNYTKPPSTTNEVTLILSGRAAAAAKGFQEIVIAALQLRNPEGPNTKLKTSVRIKVLGMDEATFQPYTDRKGIQHGARRINNDSVNEWLSDLFGEQLIGEKVNMEVLSPVPQDRVLNEYALAHGVLSAAYFEHFGLVPLEGLACGRPVLISELSGSGQFLKSRFGPLGEECVVQDFSPEYPRPLTSDVLRIIPPHAFDKRADAWADAISGLVNNIDQRLESDSKSDQR
ncbi:glycosyltransferase [Sinorhizobium meliloti]|nr:glycosyltransferase [Sinorhizobium meliloti]WQP20205.1 glycosyltransferase [Sinorhizobium meliloti]WQP36168.1 glycosyltransferase [Sinorhizobium meliloti]